MKNQPKQCPHTNKVQAESNGIIETYCGDCNELLKTEKLKIVKK